MLPRIPNVEEFETMAVTIRNAYLEERSTPNPERLKLLDILDAVIAANDQLSSDKRNSKQLQDAYMGLYLFCMESISYMVLNPEYRKGYFYNSGSVVHTLISEFVGEVSDKDKLIYLQHWRKYLETHTDLIKHQLDQKDISIDDVKRDTFDLVQSALKKNVTVVNRLVHALPVANALDGKMQAIPIDYVKKIAAKNKKVNPERVLLADIIAAVNVLGLENESEEERAACGIGVLTHTYRQNVGMLILAAQSINDGAWRAQKGRSELYDLCCEALNVDSIDDIDANTRIACLAAIRTLLADPKTIQNLEKKIPGQYMDSIVQDTIKKVDGMIEQLKKGQSMQFTISPVSLGVAAVAGLVGGVSGYGTGVVISEIVSQTNFMIDPKLVAMQLTQYAMSFVIGDASRLMSFNYASKLVDAGLERGVAKMLEAIAALLAASTGLVISVAILDVSCNTLRNLRTLYNNLRTELPLGKDADLEFVECLLEMPSIIFPREQKAKIQYATQRWFVPPQNEQTVDEQPDVTIKNSKRF